MPERININFEPSQEKSSVLSRNEQRIAVLREMWACRDVNVLLERIVLYLRKEGPASPEIQKKYLEQRQLLISLFGDSDQGLKDDLLFHGTGLYKYAGEKYQGKMDHENLVPVFEGVLQNGIAPQLDTWLPHQDMQSVSLAGNYFYAKYYASKYMSSARAVKWQYGDPNDWLWHFAADTLKDIIKNFPQVARDMYLQGRGSKERERDKEQESIQGINKIKRWLGSLRSDITPEISDLEICNGHSDISGNWGAVVCLDKSRIDAFKPAILGVHEMRSLKKVSPDFYRAIGFPMERMAEAEQLISAAEIKAKPFCIECADLHLSQFPIEQLVRRF